MNFLNILNILKNGGLIVYPTDTLYALGADIFNIKSVETIYKIKNRPRYIPLPVAVPNYEIMNEISITNEYVKILIDRFLPGPLTLVLNKKPNISDVLTGGKKSIAIRIPKNNIALKILNDFGPLVATSANIHGMPTPGIIKGIYMQFKEKEIEEYIEDGILTGKPSTIVDFTSENPKIIREGLITEEDILDAIKNG